ncbi:hypothetical protein SAMN04488102_10756 [Alkalibacterium subtropicum]|uniref:Uncharacterized protein n=1 Tax=Alkalibacterium subtropicum TaxID=753702 RepID=A0A1I1JAY4_9LACT|nr:hypothetical protein [Alkalibacterium subtropicum]SFC45769.1 hypothetical protein SAMN04488102_10756 [Alkalibacterium subtropicum]
MIESPTLHTSHTIPIDELMALSVEEYNKERPFPADRMKKIPLWKKLWNERRLKKLINKLLDDIGPYVPEIREHMDEPGEIPASVMDEVKALLIDAMKTIDEKKLLFERPFLAHFIEQGYLDVAETFIFRTRNEDSRLDNAEVFQALRNVWIMNSLQLCWEIPLALTPPMYAYSLLYPYTDNMLDDPNISPEAKQTFNRRLGKVLAGEHLSSNEPVEQRIFALVEMIKDDFPQAHFPPVTESIQLIHEGQVKSLLQSSGPPLSQEEIRTISFFKGGTSVLADAYLIKGTLTREESTFAFHYGAFLQLLDDLQDKDTDETERNQTLFSRKQDKAAVDQEIRRLITYIFTVNTVDTEDSSAAALMKDVISQCTLLMVMEAVGKNPETVTRSLYKELESFSNVRLTFYKELENKASDILKTN